MRSDRGHGAEAVPHVVPDDGRPWSCPCGSTAIRRRAMRWWNCEPDTGRRHQLRRHLAHASHPIVGDSTYGKGRHNRLFAERFGVQRLLLACMRLEFAHPATGAPVVRARRARRGIRRPAAAAGLASSAAAARDGGPQPIFALTLACSAAISAWRPLSADLAARARRRLGGLVEVLQRLRVLALLVQELAVEVVRVDAVRVERERLLQQLAAPCRRSPKPTGKPGTL